MPVLLYGLDSCPINVNERLVNPVTMAFMKMFNANSIHIASYCQSAVCFQSVREQVLRRKINVLVKLSQCQNSVFMFIC